MEASFACAETITESFSYSEKCMTLFPSVGTCGYDPFLPYKLQSPKPENLLDAVSKTLNVPKGEEVYFFRPGESKPEMLPLRYIDLKMLEYNLCIMPPDASWLLHHSENKCWKWGKQHRHAHLFDPNKKRFFIHWGTGGMPAIKNVFLRLAEKMETTFDFDDFRSSEESFRESATDSFTYIIEGKETWVEIGMEREQGYYNWQCLTHDRVLIEPWKEWFHHYR